MKKGIIILLCLVSVQSFAQWKSYYPESKTTKKQEHKEKDNTLFNAHLFTALKAKSLEDYDEALKYFLKCMKLDEKEPLPFYESAIINKNKSNFDLAIEQIKIAVSLDEENRWYRLAYAEILFDSQDFKNAAIQYKKLIVSEPGNEDLYFMLSDTYIYANQLLKAIAVYNDLEKYKGIDKMISMQKQKLYMQLHNINAAQKEIEKLLEEYPADIKVMEILSEIYLLNDKKDKAIEIFEQIVKLDPDNGKIHLTLADHYRKEGNDEQSYKELKSAFKSKKIGVDTKVRILISYIQLMELSQQMKTQAFELCEILVSVHKGNPKAHAIYADFLYTDRQIEAAKKQYLKVLELDKTKAQVWSQLLFILADQNDFKELLKQSNEALLYFSTDPLFYYFNAIANQRFNNYEASIEALEIGIVFVVDNDMLKTEFYAALADAHHATENHEQSDSLYELVLAKDPENLIVLNNYSYYLSLRKKNLEKAKKMSFRCNELERDNGTYQDTYAWILYQLGEYDLAKEWMLKALKNGGEKSAVVVEHYGDILYKLGNIDKAIIQWKKAKELGEASQFLNQKIEEGKLYE